MNAQGNLESSLGTFCYILPLMYFYCRISVNQELHIYEEMVHVSKLFKGKGYIIKGGNCKIFYHASEKMSTVKAKNLLRKGANSLLLG